MKLSSPLLSLLLIAVTGIHAQGASAKNINAVASFTVLADVVRRIGGDKVVVQSLVGPNGDPHQFEPSPDDARVLKDADLAFVSGHGLETWFEKLAKASGYQGTPVVASDGIAFRQLEQNGQISDDPHVWNSVLNVLVWTSNIEKALVAADPEDADLFRAHAERYRAELRDLDRYAHAKLDPIPRAKRKVITSHDAFGYLGCDYGITFLSPLDLSTETEASAARVAQLIVKSRKRR
jgi:zinc/manganese transport system substrate-binding protein